MQISYREDGTAVFTFTDVNKGYWSYASPASAPDGFATTIENIDLPGGVPTSMPGDGVYNDNAITSDTSIKVMLHADYNATIGSLAPLQVVGTDEGIIWIESAATSTWRQLRSGLSTTAWWSHCKYGQYLFIANPTDGVFCYDGNTLTPIGAKPIAQMESDEASLWSGETADTTNFKEGSQSMYVESSGSPATMTYTPASNFDAVTGLDDAVAYESDKSPGTDFYHFWVMFSNTGTVDTTNTKLVLTDGDTDTLTFPMTTWRTSKSASGAVITSTPTPGTWYEVWVEANDGTDSATFNAANIDTFAFTVDTSSGTLRMNVDDFYVVYLVTMPACQILAEWKNILFGFRRTGFENRYFFSPAGFPHEYDILAFADLKTNGESITGAAGFFNQLTVGTDNRTNTLSGDPQGQDYPAYLFGFNEVTNERGIGSHRSIVKGNNALYWYWKKQICVYNGTSVLKDSYPIDDYLSTADDANAQFIIGAPLYTRNQLWWTWRRSGQTVNDRVVRKDLQLQAYLPVTGLTTPTVFRSFASGAEKLLTIDVTSRKIYAQAHTSNLSFVGTAIEYVLELPPCYIPATTCAWVMNWLMWLNNSGDMTVQFRQGDTLAQLVAASYSTVETVDMDTDDEYGKNRIGERSTWMQIKFAASGAKMQLQPPFIILARPQQAQFTRNTP